MLEKAWYDGAGWTRLLLPISRLFGWLSGRRRAAYQSGRRQVYRAPVPVIVIGNITVGGTGKTPLVIELVRLLREAGFRPGVVSRGHGSRAPGYPHLVTPDSAPSESGDEALLIARRCDCPVVIDPDRPAACQALLERFPAVDIVLSDDGLQHYALDRDLEIAVLDAARGLGNGRLLPAGPLREPPGRLTEVDFLVINGEQSPPGLPAGLQRFSRMRLMPQRLVSLAGKGERSPTASTEGERIHAVAGIGHPQRFFASLSALGFAIIKHRFPDHHDFRASDLDFGDGLDIMMTEKDAVKCRRFAPPDSWYLAVDARLDDAFTEAFIDRVRQLVQQREPASTGTTYG